MKIFSFLVLVVGFLVASPVWALKLRCQGQTLVQDDAGVMEMTSYRLDYGVYGKDRFQLQIALGDDVEAWRALRGTGKYNLYGGHGVTSEDSKKVLLTMNAHSDFFPNYGPLPLRTQTPGFAKIDVVTSQVSILTLQGGKEIGLTCVTLLE